MRKVLIANTIFICILLYIVIYVNYTNTITAQSGEYVNYTNTTPVLSGEYINETNTRYIVSKLIVNKNCKCKSKSNNLKILTNTLQLPFPGYNKTTWEHITARHPNLPVDFLIQTPRCHLLPEPMGIKWVNTVWQQHFGPSGHQVYLYSAFYDNRKKNEFRPSVGVLGVTSEASPDVGWCYLWTDASRPPLVTKVIKIEYIDWQSRNATRMKPYLFSCAVPSTAGEVQMKPLTVSLAANPCGPVTNLIKVNGDSFRNLSIARVLHTSKKQSGWNTAVCAPALFYFQKDFSLRIVEWFEVLKALGIAKVFLYETDVHPNIKKVLNYYEAIGYAQITTFTWPPPYINDPSLRIVFARDFKRNVWSFENVYFTDCVLRHMHEYRFIAHFDLDELPILIKHDSFQKLMEELLRTTTKNNTSPSFYKLNWSYFYDNIPPSPSVAHLPDKLWALRHVMHHEGTIPHHNGKSNHNNGKSIYDMDSVATVFSHTPLSEICNGKKCHSRKYQIPEKVAYLGHFAKNCDKNCTEKPSVEETAYKNIRSKVSKAVSEVLRTIGLSD